MKLIAGLGNPGKQYEKTRHNVGFDLIDAFAKKHQIPLDKSKFNGVYGMGTIDGEKVILLKPLTYMNLSGESIKPMLDFYKLENKDLVVVYDDLDMPVGKIRLRMKGSAGGHNGIKSIIQHLSTQNFNRIRIGIDRPEHGSITSYVLGKFTDEENDKMTEAITRSVDACEYWLTNHFLEVMNKYN